MAKVLALPGVDPAMLHVAPAPLGRIIIIRGGRGHYTLEAEPGGPIVHPRLANPSYARSHAGRLCFRYPHTYRRVIDETGETARLSVGEMLAGTPFDGGSAA